MVTRESLVCIIHHIYDTLGPGYNECVYQSAFEVMLRKHGIVYDTQPIRPIMFEGYSIGSIRMDLIVEGDYIIELKAVSKLLESASIQTKNYMKLSGISKAILVNFPQVSDKVLPDILHYGDDVSKKVIDM